MFKKIVALLLMASMLAFGGCDNTPAGNGGGSGAGNEENKPVQTLH